jgi:hypothetical protein
MWLFIPVPFLLRRLAAVRGYVAAADDLGSGRPKYSGCLIISVLVTN